LMDGDGSGVRAHGRISRCFQLSNCLVTIPAGRDPTDHDDDGDGDGDGEQMWGDGGAAICMSVVKLRQPLTLI
jgi:hypothetical protein